MSKHLQLPVGFLEIASCYANSPSQIPTMQLGNVYLTRLMALLPGRGGGGTRGSRPLVHDSVGGLVGNAEEDCNVHRVGVVEGKEGRASCTEEDVC